MRLIRTLAAVLVLGAMAASCSTDSATAQERGQAPFDAVLIEFFGTTDTEAYLRSAEQHAAELVLECMNEAGFEFHITDAPEPVPTVDVDRVTLDQAQTDGFGIISGFREQVNRTAAPPAGGDPNLAYLATLSLTEIQRFYLTLDGEEPEPGQLPENRGCNGYASDIAYADWERFFDLVPNFTALGEERDTHPDYEAARVEWRTCMAERGHEYFEPVDVRANLMARMRDAVDQIYPGGQVPMIERNGTFTLDPSLDPLLEEFSQLERDVAVAHVECSAPLADRFAAVEHEIQQAFVEANQAEIDELLAGR